MHSKRWMTFSVSALLCFVFTGSVLLQYCKPAGNKAAESNKQNAFVGDQACKTCHSNEYHDWLKSDHFMAMQPPGDSSVKGDFNNTVFNADGVTNKFFKRNGKYIINTQGPDGANHDYEVKYTFGYYPLQQYLVEFPGGKLQASRVSWDSKGKKWFHQYAGQKVAPHDWLHWTGNSQNWNTMCASCHSTNLQKNYNIDADTYNTTFSTVNVSCESCHGEGKLHIDYINSNDYKSGNRIAGSLLQLAKNAAQTDQINTCAPCHARKSDIGAVPVASHEIMDNYIPEIPDTEHYYADGQVNDEDYIYTSFLQSKMYGRGVKCSNCHNPHTGKIVLPGNQTCLQCHAKTYDDPGHSFHAAGTVASTCVSCHMPGRYYMGNDFRHDHSLRVPRPDLSVKYQIPNACNTCHKDKTAAWAATAVAKWYGPVRKYHFAEDLVPGSRLDENSEGHLVKLAGDTTVPAIVKAAAVKYLGSIGSPISLQTIRQTLKSTDAQVRYRALQSLAGFAPSDWVEEAGALLSDNARAVRIAAADMYSSLPADQLPTQFARAFESAKKELESYLFYQADFSVGNVMIADYALRKQDYFTAEKYYLRGLRMDSMMNYARLNLSTAYNAQGKNQKALNMLLSALAIDPANERIYYNLALLYNELKNTSEAAKYFAKAVALNSSDTKVYYNYGLLLNNLKKYREAETVLRKGIAKDSAAAELYYALCFVYLQTNDLVKAKQTAAVLKQLNPSDPNYQQLFSKLGL